MRTKWKQAQTRKYIAQEAGGIFRNATSTTPEPLQTNNLELPNKNADGVTDYDFLRNRVLSEATLDYANRLADLWGSQAHEVLISLGWISETTYCQALAKHLNIEFIDDDERKFLLLPKSTTPPSILSEPSLGILVRNGQNRIVLNGRLISPAKLAEIIAVSGHSTDTIAITTQTVMREAQRRQNAHANLDRANNHLANTAPALSASTGLWPSQALTMAMLMGMIIGALAISPRTTLVFIAALLTLPFLIIVIIRLISLIILIIKSPADRTPDSAPVHPPPSDAELPVYSVLVPLYKEREILPDLIEALKMLDYPATKLDIKIILESVDFETIELAQDINLPGNFDIIIVPDGGPRTKPKALNYALDYAKGKYVVIYDAEDEPEPDQLRRAIQLFNVSDPGTACIQAQLNIYNSRESWLARQFTIEYTSLFDGLLPAFESLSLPILLGGTSNHFRTSSLRKIGGWDPYNVTEDADLGIRILRRGLRCQILPSTTFEEAPVRFDQWLKQRTRWMKGWLQTFITHTRDTAHLRRDLGAWRYIGFHAILGGTILSALFHPLFYVGLILELTGGALLSKPTSLIGQGLWHAALFNLSLGYLAAIALGWITLFRRGLYWLIVHTLGMPIYWLLISVAAYRALFQLFWRPFLWEKTTHTRSKFRTYKASDIAAKN